MLLLLLMWYCLWLVDDVARLQMLFARLSVLFREPISIYSNVNPRTYFEVKSHIKWLPN